MHREEIEQEAYFLADADDYKESSEYYWGVASEMITRSYDTPSEIIDKVNTYYSENGMPTSMTRWYETQKKSRIVNQRFNKHPNPELLARLEINSSIMMQHLSKRWLEEGDQEFMNKLIQELGDIDGNLMK